MTTLHQTAKLAAAATAVTALLAATAAVAFAEPAPPAPTPAATAPATPAAATAPVAADPAAPTSNPLSQGAPLGVTPATEGTLTDYFKSKNVKLEPQTAASHGGLRVTIPTPTNWANVPDPNVPNAYQVIVSKGNGAGIYQSNAQVFVSKLTGTFDTNEAISHGLVEAQGLPGWQQTDATLLQYQGAPAALVEGTYKQNDESLNTSRRAVIVTQGPDRYLVQLNVTTNVANAITDAEATDLIINGLRFGDAPPVTAGPTANPSALGDPQVLPAAPVAGATPDPAAPAAPPAPPAPVIPGLQLPGAPAAPAQ